jgi:hypothetical protein
VLCGNGFLYICRVIKLDMANHDPNHSSKQRTILWIISPAAVAISLLFTSLNHKVPPLREELSGKLDMKKAVEQVVTTPAVTDTIVAHPAQEQGAK